MTRTTSPAMRELTQLTGTTQTQVERWQQQGVLPRFPRSYAGGGGSDSALTEEIVERARLLVAHTRQGAQTLSRIRLIATLTKPDPELLRAAVLDAMNALRGRRDRTAAAMPPDQAFAHRWAKANEQARREGRGWTLRTLEEGPVRTGSLTVRPDGGQVALADVVALFNRDSDEEITEENLENAVDAVLRMLIATGPAGRTKVQPTAQLRAAVRELLRTLPSFRGLCEAVRTAPADRLIQAARLIPHAREMQLVAVASARIALLRHAGQLTPEMFPGWHDLGMTYADAQRMQAHPAWQTFGKDMAHGGANDTGDGHRIAQSLYDPASLDRLEAYTDFLTSLVPAQALRRMS